MKRHTYLLIVLLLSFIALIGKAQVAPGGVSSGTFNGYKADMFSGSFTLTSSFGTGTTNATPTIWGYTGTVIGREFVTQVADSYGMEYNGILAVPQTGTYSFQLINVDDLAELYLSTDGGVTFVKVVERLTTGNSAVASKALNAGDVLIRIKFIEKTGSESLKVVWSGPGLTANSEIDGRFVRYENAFLSHWYKADNSTTAVSGTNVGISKYINQAPNSINQNNAELFGGRAWTSVSGVPILINYNSAAQFDGNDNYLSKNGTNSSNGLVYQNGPFHAYNVSSYYTNIAGTSWVWGYGWDCSTNNVLGFYKNANTSALGIARAGSVIYSTNPYVLNEPKIEEGFHQLETGASATRNVLRGVRTNANSTFTTDQTYDYANNIINKYGLQYGALCGSFVNGAYLPEFIYYPFKLTSVQSQKINTYLAIKYGTTLSAGDYLSTNGTVVWNRTANASYNNRIFGIARDNAEALHQKQSQSRMRPAGNLSSEFLKVSKGSLQTTNTANTGSLNDGDYVLLGDDNAALASQSTEIPSVIDDGSCTFLRIAREWKVQITGTPGTVNFIAGSSDVGSFRFSSSMTGLTLMVDADGDGNFLTGTIRQYAATNLANGVATFTGVVLNNGEIFSFVWKKTSPGGVSTGLTHWVKANDNTAAGNMTSWDDQSGAGVNLPATSDPELIKNVLNYNPVVEFDGNDYFSISTFPTGTFTSAEVFAFGKSSSITTTRGHMYRYFGNSGTGLYTWSDGGIYESFGTNDRFGYNPASGAILDLKAGVGTTSFNYSALDWNLHNVFAATNNWGINVNGRSLVSSTSNTVDFTNLSTSIGAVPSYVFLGQISEVFLYNRVLSPAERNKINTYLAIKYSQTINQSTLQNYTSSKNLTIWNATAYSTYKNYIFGIGRDDCSGLDQRQSKSNEYAKSTNVRFGLGTINELGNELNNVSFTNDQQFLLMGASLSGNAGFFSQNSNSGIPSSYAAVNCNPKRWNQAYKVSNTANVAPVQVIVGSSTTGLRVTKGMANIQLVVDLDGDDNLTTGTQVYYLTALRKNNEVVFNNVDLPHNATWTLVWSEVAPGGVTNPSTGTSISGSTYVNGLEYKLYSLGTASGSIASGFSAYSPTLLSTGYYHNATNFHDFVLNKIADQFGLELSGKLFVASGSTTYQFRANIDDQFALIIDGTTIIDRTTTATNFLSSVITLTSGYHDIIIRGRELTGAQVFDLSWNGGSGSTFTAIPDANFFVRVAGPSAWFAADDGSFSSVNDLASIPLNTIWYDQSVNGNNLALTNGDAVYRKNSLLRNFNEQVRFDEDRFSNSSNLTGFAYGKQNKTNFSVLSFASTGGVEVAYGWGSSGTGTIQGLYSTSTGDINYWGFGVDVSIATAYWTSTARTNSIATMYRNSNIFATNNAFGFGDNKQLGNPTITSWSTTMAPSIQYQAGNGYPQTDSQGWNGDIDELIHYPWDLSASEMLKVNSYLAIRWGLTLDQTTATNYVASDGTVIWNATAKSGFKNDITGIGRDDCGALEQLQSTSIDGPDMVSMGRGGIATSNTLNLNSFASNKSFIIFGHDNGVVTNLSQSNMPTVFTSSSFGCYSRLGRVWQAQVTGTPGTVSIQMGKTGVMLFSKTYYKPKLMVSNSATNWTSATIYNATSVVNGVVQFDDVTIPDGAFFTVAIINAAPGGITSNLNLWLEASDGPSTTTDNTAVTSWNDLGLLGMNGTSVGSPLFRSGASAVAANFNPVMGFNGTSQFFNLPTGFNDFTAGLTSFAVLNTNFGTVTSGGRILHLASSANANLWAFNRQAATNNVGSESRNASSTIIGSMATTTAPLAAANGFSIYDVSYAAGSSGATAIAGTISVNGAGTTVSTLAVPTTISRTVNKLGAGGSSTEWINGYIPEVILYNKALTAAERLKIQSYLAVKYGKTLNSSVAAYKNVLNADVYNYANFWNRITGIARDDCQGLEQLQSKSVENGALITIGNGNSLFADNPSNTNAFTTNNTWLLFGDNNKNLLWSGVDLPVATDHVRINRVWRVAETGTLGNVFLQVPAHTSALTTKLPAPDLDKPVYLLVANSASNGKFSSTTGVTEVEMTLNGANWEVSYDFVDGDYFTFSTDKLCLAPGGITEGITTWYRMDNKAAGTIAATSGTLADEMGNHTLTRNANGTATVASGSSTVFNYNSVLTLASNAAFSKTSLSETSVVNPNEGTMYGVATSATNLFMLSNNTTNIVGINGQPRFMAGTAGGFSNSTSPNIYKIGIGSGVLNGSQNGTSVSSGTVATSLASAATYTLGLGTFPAGSSAFNNATIAEAVSFNRDLTTVETQIVNSILAIKYGGTLSHNYFHPNYDGTNAAQATLYNISTYGNRIFGVGRDDVSCLSQNQSISQLTGSMLKVSVDGIFNAENSKLSLNFDSDRCFLLLGDDNGALTWVNGGTAGNREKPYAYSGSNCWDRRINRQWKVTNTNMSVGVLVAIPSSSSSAATKLGALPTPEPSGNPYKVVMLVNKNPDFSANAGQVEVEMDFNSTTNDFEANYHFPKNQTVYITFATRLSNCGVRCIVTNLNIKK
ncbi:hypothetical protein ACQKCH_14120 [Nubsella zeaxanthinifaciens]|uniref:hypothetical protein n=1 Tax=Nubsella zeaxanthinifaciens TaxID=392412 RepID=UPI003D01450C